MTDKVDRQDWAAANDRLFADPVIAQTDRLIAELFQRAGGGWAWLRPVVFSLLVGVTWGVRGSCDVAVGGVGVSYPDVGVSYPDRDVWVAVESPISWSDSDKRLVSELVDRIQAAFGVHLLVALGGIGEDWNDLRSYTATVGCWITSSQYPLHVVLAGAIDE